VFRLSARFRLRLDIFAVDGGDDDKIGTVDDDDDIGSDSTPRPVVPSAMGVLGIEDVGVVAMFGGCERAGRGGGTTENPAAAARPLILIDLERELIGEV
jgi:hypothetical protein